MKHLKIPLFYASQKVHYHVHKTATSGLYLILYPDIRNRSLYQPLASLVLHTLDFYVKLDGGTLGPKHVKGKGKGKGKGKAIPLQAWTRPEGFRRLGLPDWKTIGT